MCRHIPCNIHEHVAIFEYPICCLARPSSSGRLRDVSSDALRGERIFSRGNFIFGDFEVIFRDRGWNFTQYKITGLLLLVISLFLL